MSNTLKATVPVFDGINWAKWSEPMVSYLLSQGQFKFLTEDEPDVETLSQDGSNAAAVSKSEDKLEAWQEGNGKVLGNMRLRLSPSVMQAVGIKSNAKDLWQAVRDTYSQTTLRTAYTEFRGLLELCISDDAAPGHALAKFQGHVEQLKTMKVELGDYVALMLLMSKMPAYGRSLASITTMQTKLVESGQTGHTDPRQYMASLSAA